MLKHKAAAVFAVSVLQGYLGYAETITETFIPTTLQDVSIVENFYEAFDTDLFNEIAFDAVYCVDIKHSLLDLNECSDPGFLDSGLPISLIQSLNKTARTKFETHSPSGALYITSMEGEWEGIPFYGIQIFGYKDGRVAYWDLVITEEKQDANLEPTATVTIGNYIVAMMEEDKEYIENAFDQGAQIVITREEGPIGGPTQFQRMQITGVDSIVEGFVKWTSNLPVFNIEYHEVAWAGTVTVIEGTLLYPKYNQYIRQKFAMALKFDVYGSGKLTKTWLSTTVTEKHDDFIPVIPPNA